jgi:multiple sugar transport system permease protein
MARNKNKMAPPKLYKRILLFYIPIILIVGFILFPMAWTFLSSIKPTQEMFTKKVIYFPKDPTLENYIMLLTKTDFVKSTMNSLEVAALTVLISLVVSSMAGYAFSRYRFRGSNIYFSSILLVYMFPTVLYLIPLYETFRRLHLLGHVYSLVIAYTTFTIPFAIWLMTNFINGLPYEVEEAAKIDGANVYQCFTKIILPLLRPGMVAAGTYIFINSWNEYIFSIMFTSSSNTTLPVMLADCISEYNIRWDLLTAGGVLALIPALILFMFFQKHLVAGLTGGAVKG